MLFVISGPSGCGKSTLVQHILDNLPDIVFSVSHTTRARRRGEEEGQDYYFVDKPEFDRMIAEGRLVEWAVVYGHYYGTSKRELERIAGGNSDIILDIDIQGAKQIKEKHTKGIFIFVMPPSFRLLKERLEKRGTDAPDVIQNRLTNARKEIRAYPQFDFVVINDDLDTARQEVSAIVLSERCRLSKRQKRIIPILRSFTESR